MNHSRNTAPAPDAPAIETPEPDAALVAKAKGERLKHLAADAAHALTTGDTVRALELMEEMRELTEVVESGDESGAEEITLDSLETFDPAQDPTRLLGISRRFLCETGSLLFVGESGIGKSSLLMDAGLHWCAGRAFFGISVARPMRILFVQRENDRGDLAEAFQGVMQSRGFSADEVALIRANLLIIHETARTGEDFAAWLERKIKGHRSDIVAVDPLLSFAGCAVADQEMMGRFLRQMIQPVLNRTRAAMILAHHSGKPGDKANAAEKTDSALKYIGLGSSELTNWARAIACLRMVDESGRVCEFSIPKRGDRAGMTDDAGNPVTRIHIRHGRDSITWERATGYVSGASGPKGGGRPPKTSPETLRGILDREGAMGLAELRGRCVANGITGGTFDRMKNTAIEAGLIQWRDGELHAVFPKTFIATESA